MSNDEHFGVYEFENFEQAIEFMQRNEAAAAMAVTPEQLKIVGDCYVKRTDAPVTIYGQVFGLETFIENESKYYDMNDDVERAEFEYSVVHHEETYARGYRFGNWFSEWCPEGEPGSAHIVSMRLISEEEFNMAKEQGWK